MMTLPSCGSCSNRSRPAETTLHGPPCPESRLRGEALDEEGDDSDVSRERARRPAAWMTRVIPGRMGSIDARSREVQHYESAIRHAQPVAEAMVRFAQSAALPISARDMTGAERRYYEQKGKAG